MPGQSIAKTFNLRIPADIRKWLEDEARKNMRSLNNEIVFKLTVMKASGSSAPATVPDNKRRKAA
jgi:predicted HicB family RNase H-like nuclease